MAKKRLTDTEIWEQDWYIDLPNKYKLLWNYVKDKCDNAGIWRPNKSLAQRIIGEPLHLDEFLQFVNLGKERISMLPSGRWFLREFFIFQYGDTFSPKSQVHKGALKQLLANGVHIKDLLNLDSGKLKDIDFQSLKEIAYQKDINILKEAYGYPMDKTINKNKNNNSNSNTEESNCNSDLGSSIKGKWSDDSISFSVSGIGKVEIKVAPCEGWEKEEIKTWLTKSEREFQTIAMSRPEFKNALNLQSVLQKFTGIIQKKGDYKDARGYKQYFVNWLEKQNVGFSYNLQTTSTTNSTGMPKLVV